VIGNFFCFPQPSPQAGSLFIGTCLGVFVVAVGIVRSIAGYKPPFQLNRCQFFIRVRNETLAVVATSVCNPD
jgi:hypothetical protein